MVDDRPDRLPIIVGVTGHRDLDLRPEFDAALRAAVDAIFERLAREYPATPLLLLTPLAEGADRLVAEVARARAIPYRVPLPMPLEDYREDFADGPSRDAFDALAAGAQTPPYTIARETSDAAVLASGAPGPARRAEAYAEVGAHLVRSCHVLIALWDGVPSDAVGGTAQVVSFRVLGLPQHLTHRSILDEPDVGPVHHIYAARAHRGRPARPVGTCMLRVRGDVDPNARGFDAIDERENAADPFVVLYARIEAFNRDCLCYPAPKSATESEAATSRMRAVAECLASHYQRKAGAALVRLFGATAVAGIIFVSYADLFPALHVLVIPYILALVVAVTTFVRADRGRWQDRAQDYRALELGLSVQRVWDAVGLRESVAEYYVARQRTELDWIPQAIGAVHTLDLWLPFDEAAGIAAVRAFLSNQYAYFAGTNGRAGVAVREDRRRARYDALRRWALRAGFIASAALVAFALSAWFRPDLYGEADTIETWHGRLIFTIGIAAVAAALCNDYVERRGFREHAERYAMMAGIYRRALSVLDDSTRSPLETARAVISEVGHEALTENGDWILLHRARPIELLQIA